jgi:hypothetical protein
VQGYILRAPLGILTLFDCVMLSLLGWVSCHKRHLSSCNSMCHFCGWNKPIKTQKWKNPSTGKSLLIPRIKAPNLKIRRKLQKHPFQSIRKEACSNEWNCVCVLEEAIT